MGYKAIFALVFVAITLLFVIPPFVALVKERTLTNINVFYLNTMIVGILITSILISACSYFAINKEIPMKGHSIEVIIAMIWLVIVISLAIKNRSIFVKNILYNDKGVIRKPFSIISFASYVMQCVLFIYNLMYHWVY